ncbi:MAG: SDR family NAD(P)-dependent oxidoreductase [Hymenobacter sp.]|nr:SDR family NAD(P)-dependent oxidoreductase [Hymenobacter sp.]
MMNFTDKVVVLTGAAGGIGSAIARRFLAEGAKVCATDISDKVLDKLKEELGAPAQLLTVVADISDEASCQYLADQVRQRWDAMPSTSLSTTRAGFPSATSKTSPTKSGRRSRPSTSTGRF